LDIFSSFLRSNIKTIHDIWDENSKQFIDCDLLYSKLIDRRNCKKIAVIKKVSLNLKSSLLNQYFPIAFQFLTGSLIMR
jgi:hypothetical protein